MSAPKPHRTLWCLLFGHRFMYRMPLATRYVTADFCTRCGMRPWTPRER